MSNLLYIIRFFYSTYFFVRRSVYFSFCLTVTLCFLFVFNNSQLFAQNDLILEIHTRDNKVKEYPLKNNDSLMFSACLFNQLHSKAFNPSPVDKSVKQPLNVIISWQCTDPENDTLFYDIYFGIDANPSLVKLNSTDSFFNPGVLAKNMEYFWKIVAKDKYGKKTESSLWSFTTTLFVCEMIFVEGGSFLMGQPDPNIGGIDYTLDEQPVHNVSLDSFYIAKYELTQQQWIDITGTNPSAFNNCLECPVENVSWNDVSAFISKLNELTGDNYRLPTEAEWEYAAKGANKSKGYVYSGSNNAAEVAWYVDNSGDEIHPVGQKNPNELGIYDMSGNVWEFCSDWYQSYYYEISPGNNPKGPDKGTTKIIRGGSKNVFENITRTCFRGNLHPASKFNIVGLRLVK